MTAHSISILSELKMTPFGPYEDVKKRSPSVALPSINCTLVSTPEVISWILWTEKTQSQETIDWFWEMIWILVSGETLWNYRYKFP